MKVKRIEHVAIAVSSIAAIREMHKFLYRQGKTLDEARAAIQGLATTMPEAAADIALMDDFLATSASGIAR